MYWRINGKAGRGLDRRRYNEPTGDELAIMMPGDGTEQQHSHDIVVQKRAAPAGTHGNLQIISGLHAAYEPLCFFCFSPEGSMVGPWACSCRPVPKSCQMVLLLTILLTPSFPGKRGRRVTCAWMVLNSMCNSVTWRRLASLL